MSFLLEATRGVQKGVALRFLHAAGLVQAKRQVVDLSGADLKQADLRGAVLRGISLRDTYLTGADLREADLSGGDLMYATFVRVNFEGAKLHDARFSHNEIVESGLDFWFLKSLGAIGVRPD